jgi:hypothetical protein
MPKYYVSCGNFKLVISRQTPILAAMAAIRVAEKKYFSGGSHFFMEDMKPSLNMYPGLEETTDVSEEGFSNEAKIVESFDTIFVMTEVMMEDFKNFGK